MGTFSKFDFSNLIKGLYSFLEGVYRLGVIHRTITSTDVLYSLYNINDFVVVVVVVVVVVAVLVLVAVLPGAAGGGEGAAEAGEGGASLDASA